MDKKIEKRLTVYDGNKAYEYVTTFETSIEFKTLKISKNNYSTDEKAHYDVKRHIMFSGTKISSTIHAIQTFKMPSYKVNVLSIILVLKRYKDGV